MIFENGELYRNMIVFQYYVAYFDSNLNVNFVSSLWKIMNVSSETLL